MRARRGKHIRAAAAITAAVTLLLALILYGAGLALGLGWARSANWLQYPSVQLEKWEFNAFDALLLAARGPVPATEQVTIIALDQDTVSQVGVWPFSRAVHARLIRQLKAWGAKVIVFDVLFDAERAGDAAGDQELVDACREAGNVILAAEMNAGERDDRLGVRHVQVIRPFEALAEAAEFGLTNFSMEDDHSARRAKVWEEVAETRVPLLSVLAAARYLGEDPDRIVTGGALRMGKSRLPLDAEGCFWLNYGGAAGHISRLPYYQALQGTSGGELVKDRIVFVGSTDPAQQDVVISPYGAGFPGVEVHANVADMLLRNRPLRRLPAWTALPLAALLAAGMGGIAVATRPVRALGFLPLFAVAYAGGAALLFARGGVWIPVVTPLVGGGLAWVSALSYRYLTEERERKRISGLFSKYVSKDVAEELMEDESRGDLRRSRRLYLTCLFSDIRGFTTISENLQPEEVVTMLNDYFDGMVDCVFENRGTLDKYVGDAIMATFGVPKSYGNDAERACRTAVRMREELAGLQAKWAAEGKTGIDIGIGVNSGEAVVGTIGSVRRLEYTCIGDTINVASRLEGLNKELGTKALISESTYEHVKDLGLFEMRRLPPAAVKGRAEPVQVYELLGWMRPPEGAPAPAERAAPAGCPSRDPVV